jgi:signal transduction histidine kinase
VIDDGTVLHRAEAVLGANDLAFKAAGQAVLLVEDRELGVADDATVALAVAEARNTSAELGARVAELLEAVAGQAPNLAVAASRVAEASRELVEVTESGRAEEAGRLLSGDAKEAFEALRDTTMTVRDSKAVAFASANGMAGLIANVASFLVAFLLPAAAVVTYRVATRRQLRIAQAQFDTRLEAERNIQIAKDEFIANLSHELRTPLTSIYGFSELLLEQGLIDPDLALDLIGLINDDSADLARMVEDLLVTARIDAGAVTYDLQPVNVANELETVLVPFLRTGLNVEVDCPSVEVWADPLRVRQVLRNLVSNAAKHGGSTVNVTAAVEGNELVCAVTDDGSGVPAEIEIRLFTRFVHEGDVPLTAGSVGLGLAVVKGLLVGMGGDVNYERDQGWTRFSMRLPLAIVRSDHTPIMGTAGEQELKSALANLDATVVAGRSSHMLPKHVV